MCHWQTPKPGLHTAPWPPEKWPRHPGGLQGHDAIASTPNQTSRLAIIP